MLGLIIVYLFPIENMHRIELVDIIVNNDAMIANIAICSIVVLIEINYLMEDS